MREAEQLRLAHRRLAQATLALYLYQGDPGRGLGHDSRLDAIRQQVEGASADLRLYAHRRGVDLWPEQQPEQA